LAAARHSLQADSGDDPISLELLDRRHRLKGGAIAVGRGGSFSLTLISVETSEKRGRMRIKRIAFEFGRARDFVYDGSLSEATLSPPWPFAGKGIFKRLPSGGASWTGSLSVVLPGRARISLGPPRFRARLHRSE
jgi:hypothetical protein